MNSWDEHVIAFVGARETRDAAKTIDAQVVDAPVSSKGATSAAVEGVRMANVVSDEAATKSGVTVVAGRNNREVALRTVLAKAQEISPTGAIHEVAALKSRG